MASQLLELDARRRTSFGKIGRNQDTRYIVETFDNGEIHLTPAVVMSEREAQVLRDAALQERLRSRVERAKAGETVKLDMAQLDRLEADD